MDAYYTTLLEEAQSEVRQWQKRSCHAEKYATSGYDEVVTALDRAKRASSMPEFKRRVHTVLHQTMAEAPLTTDLMPSFYRLVDALWMRDE